LKSGSLNLLESSGPVQAVMGLLYLNISCMYGLLKYAVCGNH